jgi:hypothetical protein
MLVGSDLRGRLVECDAVLKRLRGDPFGPPLLGSFCVSCQVDAADPGLENTSKEGVGCHGLAAFQGTRERDGASGGLDSQRRSPHNPGGMCSERSHLSGV